MIKKKLLTVGMTTMLLGTTLFAQGNCVGGVCFINLDKIKPSKSFKKEKQPLVVLAKPRFIERNVEVKMNNSDDFVMFEEKVDKTIDIVVNNEEIYVFPSYVMTDTEKANYIEEQEAIALNEKANMKANQNLLIVKDITVQTEDRILAKTILPTSDYYCEKDMQPVYDQGSNAYECV